MTTEKQAIKTIADSIMKAVQTITEQNNRLYVDNRIKNLPVSGGSGGGGGEIPETIPASKVTGLYNTVAGYIINAESAASGGDVIAAAILNTLNGIAEVQIGRARIDYAKIDNLDTGVANIVHLTTQSGEIHDADIRQLKADIATVGLLNINTANIGYAQIKDLVTQTAIFREGMGGELYLDRLYVTDANLLSLNAGKIMLKDVNGQFVRLEVNEQGQVVGVPETFDGDDVINNNSLNGLKLEDGTVTVDKLNVNSLFANTAFLNGIYTNTIQNANAGTDIDISGNSAITLLSGKLALVVDGSSTSSSLVLTDKMIQAISDEIDVRADTIDLSGNTSVALKVQTEVAAVVPDIVEEIVPDIVDEAVDEAVAPLTTRVTTLEGTVETQAGQIALRATKTELQAVDDVVISHSTQIGNLQTNYNTISATVASVHIDYYQETQPLNPSLGEIWYRPSVDKRYLAIEDPENPGSITWQEVQNTDFSNLSVTVTGLQSTVSDVQGNLTQVTQTANKIYWVLESNSTSSNMTLTSDMAELVFDTVSLRGDEIDLSANSTVQITSEDQISVEAANNLDLSSNGTILAQAQLIQAQANRITLVANSVDEMDEWFDFSSNGFKVQKPNGSKWSTLTNEEGFFINHEEVDNFVGAFHREMLEVHGLKVGQTIVRPGQFGGWVWSDS